MKTVATIIIAIATIFTTQASDTIISQQIDTICYIYDSNRTTVITIHPPSSKTKEKIDTFYSYVFVPTHYIPFSKGRLTKVHSYWQIYDTLYLSPDVDPCNGDEDSEEDLIFYIYSRETKTYSKFYHIPEHGIYRKLKNIIIQ